MKRLLTTLTIATGLSLSLQAADFLSAEPAETPFTLGVRLGLNTSNRTLRNMPGYQKQNWGIGFDAGVVADINIRDYISIQPGFFFESRSGSYIFITPRESAINPLHYVTQAGHRRSYNFTVPVMASLRFNLSDDVRWLVEAGPYVSFVLSSSLRNDELVSTGILPETEPPFEQKPAGADFGLKFGTGIQVFGHYYAGIHYLAGLTRAYKNQPLSDGYSISYEGHTKSWMFTIGYNF